MKLVEVIPHDSRDYATIEEVAVATGRSVGTVRRWVKEGRLTRYRLLGRVVFRRAEIDQVPRR